MARTQKPAQDPALSLERILDEEGRLVGERPGGLDDAALLRMYRAMRFQRLLDDRMLTLQRQGRIGFYGACTGQEATVFGSGMALEPHDWVFPALREGGVALLRGYPLEDYVAQLFGSRNDKTKGRQMPCHYCDAERRFVSVSSPIGTQLTQAIGAAHAARIRHDDAVVIGYLGDGATSSGDFHVAMRFAGAQRLPVVLLCANNQWAISVPWDKQTASRTIAVKARAYGMEGVRVDGNDALAVYDATRRAVDKARAGGGPTFIEALTYRLGAHSTSDDPSRYRDEAITEQWRGRDPIERLRKLLGALGVWDDAREEKLCSESNLMIRKTIDEQEGQPAPGPRTLFEDVYAQVPTHLREQSAELLRTLTMGGPSGH